jgi:DNA-binding beta-propeller fold protein YncE
MPLQHVGYVDLPPHTKAGGFDHAAVDHRNRRVYVAHTANDALDVIDGATHRYVGSIDGLTAVAGALVAEEHDLVFTSNRGENTVGIVSATHQATIAKVRVGIRPNGLAYDPGLRHLYVAIGDPGLIEVLDTETMRLRESVPTEKGAHTLAFDAASNTVYAFLPATHRATVYADRD